MKTLILIYDGYAEFEVNLVGLFMKGKGEVEMVADRETDFVTGTGNFRTVAHVQLSEVDPSEYDLLAIPGGDLTHLLDQQAVLNLIRAFHVQGKLIGAICAGPALLAAAGVLADSKFTTSFTKEEEPAANLFAWEHFTDEDVTVAGNLVTAKGNAYVEFAVALYEQLNLFESEADKEETFDYFQNRQSCRM